MYTVTMCRRYLQQCKCKCNPQVYVTRDVLGAKAAIWDAQEDAQKEAYLAMELWLPEKRRASPPSD